MSDVRVSGGMGFLGWLGLAFIILKLTGYIHWSWIWVLCPLWIGLAIVLSLVIAFFVAFGVALIGAKFVDRANARREQKKHDAFWEEVHRLRVREEGRYRG